MFPNVQSRHTKLPSLHKAFSIWSKESLYFRPHTVHRTCLSDFSIVRSDDMSSRKLTKCPTLSTVSLGVYHSKVYGMGVKQSKVTEPGVSDRYLHLIP